MTLYPKILISLIEQLKKLPGVGRKSAERFAFKILEWPERDQKLLSETLSLLHTSIEKCSDCGCFKDQELCSFCHKTHRSPMLCIIASPKDAYAIEQTRMYLGYYHVLGCLLSPLDGKTPLHLNLEKIKERITRLHIEEVILALDPTLEGDATALYLYDHFHRLGLKVTKLALGLPVGSSLDFIDEGTLSQAFNGRQSFHH